MKVLQVHNFYRTQAGECNVVQSERKLLSDHGDDVYTFYRDSKDIDQWDALHKVSMIWNIPYSRTVEKDLTDYVVMQKPDIAHVHNVFPLLTPSVYSALKNCEIPVVHTLHNFRMICPNGKFYVNNQVCEDCQKYGYFSAIRKRCMHDNIFVSAAYSMALSLAWKNHIYPDKIDRYIALNNFYREKLINAGVQRDRIHLLDNFISNINKSTISKKKYVLFLGRLSKEKGINTLLEAWKSIDGAILKVAGSGPLQQYLEKQLELPGNHNVEYLGHVTGEMKRNLIEEALCMVVPSEWYENFPISIVESMSLGTPVIVSRIGGLPDLIDHGKNGLIFEPGDINGLSESINKFILNERFAAYCSENALEIARERFDAEKHYKRLMAIYDLAITNYTKK